MYLQADSVGVYLQWLIRRAHRHAGGLRIALLASPKLCFCHSGSLFQRQVLQLGKWLHHCSKRQSTCLFQRPCSDVEGFHCLCSNAILAPR